MQWEGIMSDDRNRDSSGAEAHSAEVDLSGYPLDGFLIRTDHRSIWQVMQWIKCNQYLLQRDFQHAGRALRGRAALWDEIKQSKLIESVLMRIPLPPFYLAEQLEGTIVVVDGLQRLNTFMRYLNNEFALKGVSEELNSKKFDDLSPKLKRRLEDTTLSLFLIDSKVPALAQASIFERLNSGVPFSRA